jgi:hypothetical protein
MPKTNINLFDGLINCGVMMVNKPVDQDTLPDLRILGVVSIAHVRGGTRISFGDKIPSGIEVKHERILGAKSVRSPSPKGYLGLTIPGDSATITSGAVILTVDREQ